jgi:hypothetical protein
MEKEALMVKAFSSASTVGQWVVIAMTARTGISGEANA